MQGGEIKRTTIAKGKNPVFDDVFMVPAGTPALEFVALDKEGGVKAVDDVIGGGIWNCAEATSRGFTGQPFQSNSTLIQPSCRSPTKRNLLVESFSKFPSEAPPLVQLAVV